MQAASVCLSSSSSCYFRPDCLYRRWAQYLSLPGKKEAGYGSFGRCNLFHSADSRRPSQYLFAQDWYLQMAGTAVAVGTPLAMFAVVQIIVQLTERRSTASISYLRIIKYAVFDMPVGDFLRNLVIYYFILVLLILLIRKINIACMVYCLLMVLLVLVNYYVTEFRGQAFLPPGFDGNEHCR